MSESGFRHLLVGLDVDPDKGEICPGSLLATRQARALVSRTGGDLRFVHSLHHERHGRHDDEDDVRPAPAVHAALDRFVAEEAPDETAAELLAFFLG